MKKLKLIIPIIVILLIATMVAFGTSVPLGPYFDDGYFSLTDDALILDSGIGDLSDIDLTDIADEKILQYNFSTSKWECEDAPSGYTNLTSFVDQTAWRLFYSNTDGDVTELALGADGTYLKSNGATSAPTFTAPAGGGDVSVTGTPVDSQVAVWTDGTHIEGAASLTYDGANLQLTGDIGSTGTKITKGWFTDLTVTNAIAGSVTGNAATVTTNANLTGIVTSTGNATVIADKAIAIAKLADGTDGNLITWSAAGVIAVVATGDADQVLTSNGVGTAPTFQAAGAGYTNLTSFVDQTAWRVFYSDTAGDVTEVALGDSGSFLGSNGATSAPSFKVPAGSGDVSKVGTPADSQIGVWTGDGTIEGDASLTYDRSNLQLTGDIGSTGARITKGWFANLETTGDLTVNGTALGSIYAVLGANSDITSLTGLTTALAANYGGTGVANAAAETITIGGAGTYGVTLTLTNTTDVTLPTTGTLATLAGTETFTNKTLTSPKLNEDVAVTTTATKLNYITSATGTTGTVSTNIVFSTSPTFITPTLGAAAATSLNIIPSQYPPAQSDTYVKATTKANTDYWPYFATDPAKSLTGHPGTGAWFSGSGSVTNQRFHIDLGSAKILKRIYYENVHDNGGTTTKGVKNFTFWGSNTGAGSFDDLVYANDEGWTQLTTSQATFDIHSAANEADPKYITVTNTTAYRYYAFKFADNYGDASYMGVRRIELQTGGEITTGKINLKQAIEDVGTFTPTKKIIIEVNGIEYYIQLDPVS